MESIKQWSVPRFVYMNATLALLLIMLGVVTGCSTFNRQWKAAGQSPPPAGDITGRWEGTWHSEATDHQGRLRCVVTQEDDTRYQAHFRAVYRKIFRFSQKVDLEVIQTNGHFSFSGVEDLGWWAGGVYQYEGHATPTNFVSTYQSEDDHGIYKMKRPE